MRPTPFYLGPDGAQTFGWVHQPDDTAGLSRAVILCNPLGHEMIHLHRTYRHWAEQLADMGNTVVRFDYLGSGNSTASPFDVDGIEPWINNIHQYQDWLTTCGYSQIVLGGIRLGATLAALSAQAKSVAGLMLWNPVIRGKRYARELRALSGLSGSNAAEGADIGLECGGFPIHQSTLDAISAVDLRQASPADSTSTLLIRRDDLPDPPTLSSQLDWPQECAEIVGQGYQEMLAEPQDTKVPRETLAQVTEWLQSTIGVDAATHPEPMENIPSDSQQRQTPHGRETLHWTGSQPSLFCSSNIPTNFSSTGTVVVFVNAGAVHHVGPNRLYYELAAHLAAEGIASIRCDLRNLGDSARGTPLQENHPYPNTAISDIENLLADVQQQYPKATLVLAGLCSGAHAAFHAALAGLAFDRFILINPLTFYWHPGLSLDIPSDHTNEMEAIYLTGALTRPGKWKKLLTGKVDIRHIVGFVSQYLGSRLTDLWAATLRRLKLKRPSPLASDLEKLDEANISLHFIFSSTDPGSRLLFRYAGNVVKKALKNGRMQVRYIANADHTFSRQKHRNRVAVKLLKILKSG